MLQRQMAHLGVEQPKRPQLSLGRAQGHREGGGRQLILLHLVQAKPFERPSAGITYYLFVIMTEIRNLEMTICRNT